ncbi:parallel beta-helix repeat protein [Russula earlei]|uniref:Parallel beta-helix repeat protein n=1 Tax=Russula earlei TaxID=71964 RepID=A0ACC0TQW4_9AGAM|nr:parallel beta-helix repeat protein [Russula earlei]
MNTRLVIVLLLMVGRCVAQQPYGATIPWITYEAEHMQTNGKIIGPAYDPYKVETESSGQRAVLLRSKSEFVQFASGMNANSMVIRYSIPDSKDGKGLEYPLEIFINGKLIRHCTLTSRYAWLYGKYPFTNNPADGKPRHFYDEIQITNLPVSKGDVIRIQPGRSLGDTTAYCIIDLVDLEIITPPLKAPANSLSVTDNIFRGKDSSYDYTEAFQKCIAKAIETDKTVWIPAGRYMLTHDIMLPANIRIQGAGMWYTTLVGNEVLYTHADRRVRLIGNGSNIHIAGFSIAGELNYRSDQEANDGITGSFGTNSTISDIWIEHTKVGMWIENSSNLTITNCRIRNTMADGINFCVGMSHSTINNCTTRGTGDDGFAIWPAVFKPQQFSPGFNTITHCTAQLPYLANGAAIYGGEHNAIQNCFFADITQGSAILISTTFPTSNKSVDNNFSGITIIKNCLIKTSGGFDHEWGWRAAVEICLDKRSISGLAIDSVFIDQSLSNAISIIAKNADSTAEVLRNAILENVHVAGYSIGVKNKRGLFISDGVHGLLTIRQSSIPGISGNTELNMAR